VDQVGVDQAAGQRLHLAGEGRLLEQQAAHPREPARPDRARRVGRRLRDPHLEDQRQQLGDVYGFGRHQRVPAGFEVILRALDQRHEDRLAAQPGQHVLDLGPDPLGDGVFVHVVAQGPQADPVRLELAEGADGGGQHLERRLDGVLFAAAVRRKAQRAQGFQVLLRG